MWNILAIVLLGLFGLFQMLATHRLQKELAEAKSMHQIEHDLNKLHLRRSKQRREQLQDQLKSALKCLELTLKDVPKSPLGNIEVEIGLGGVVYEFKKKEDIA